MSSESETQIYAQRAIEPRDSFNYLDAAGELGTLETILLLNGDNLVEHTRENSMNALDYIFSIFSNICEESHRIMQDHYSMLLYFYDCVDLLKVKYSLYNFIILAINMILENVENHMKNNINSEKTNYILLKEIIGVSKVLSNKKI